MIFLRECAKCRRRSRTAHIGCELGHIPVRPGFLAGGGLFEREKQKEVKNEYRNNLCEWERETGRKGIYASNGSHRIYLPLLERCQKCRINDEA